MLLWVRFRFLGEDCSTLSRMVRPVRRFGGCNQAFCGPEAVAFLLSLTEAAKHPPLISEHDDAAVRYWREIGRSVLPCGQCGRSWRERSLQRRSNRISQSSKFRSADPGEVDWTRVRIGSGVRPMRGKHGMRVENPFPLCFRASDLRRGLPKLFLRFPRGTGPSPPVPHRAEPRIEQAERP